MFSAQSTIVKRSAADVVVVPFWSFNGKAKVAVVVKDLEDSYILSALEGFNAEVGEIRVIYRDSSTESRLILLGLGKEGALDRSSVRNAYGLLTAFCKKEKWTSINIVLPPVSRLNQIHPSHFIECLSEGILSVNYCLPRYGKCAEEQESRLEKVCLYGIVPTVANPVFERILMVYEGVYLTRNLVNQNADDVTPDYLATTAKSLGKAFPALEVTVFDKKMIDREMGLLSAVSQGSSVPPKFIVLQYQGKPRSKDVTVFVGKGVTYDTGGLDLKPGKSMLTMKEDMSGAAAVLGIMNAIAALKLKANIVAIIPATENAIGSAAYKQGDVYLAYSGESVEIISTDAEGRLILADAIGYAVRNFHPTRIIDFATLTGAMVVSLGEEIAGMFCNNDALSDALLNASELTGETVWRMPLYSGYNKSLKSDIADMKNIGSNRSGAITAALFLQRFVQNISWAHFDIAGTAYQDKSGDCLPKYASGFGVRLIVSYIENNLAS